MTNEATNLTFDEWLKQIDALAAKFFGGKSWPQSYTESTGFDCWRNMYNDGLSPNDAWSEEEDAMDDDEALP